MAFRKPIHPAGYGAARFFAAGTAKKPPPPQNLLFCGGGDPGAVSSGAGLRRPLA